jgi:type IV secretion system protein VirB11
MNGVLQAEALPLIERAVFDRKNIMVVGGTSSGKTTFVNSILDAVCRLTPDDRVLILEDTTELQCRCSNSVSLHTSEIVGAEVNLRMLAKVCMRYAPKRIVVGEVRDAAALELLKLWNTGHPGGVGTFHADGADEAL